MDNLNVKRFSVPKIIFTILGLILLVELVYVARVLFTPPSPPARSASPSIQVPAGTISLNTPQTTFNVNEVVPVSVMVDTGNHKVSGVDVIIRFDPKILEATKAGLIKGRLLDEYPLVSVDAKQGLISISGISSLQNGFKGKGIFALINFKAKMPGSTPLIIDFENGSTTDSNLVEADSSKDILETVSNLELNIQ